MPRKATGNKNGRPRKTRLTDQQQEALKIALAHNKEWHWLSMPARRLAERMNVTPRTIYKWRNDPIYIDEYYKALGKEIADKIENSDTQKTTAEMKRERINQTIHRTAALEVYLEKHWAGPMISPLDGVTRIASPDEYLIHLKQYGCLPYELAKLQYDHVDEVLAKDPAKSGGRERK